jgi:ATP phosphoribosyltransferase regulatory subunit
VAAGGRYDSLLSRLKVQLGDKALGADGGAAGCIVRPWRAWAGGAA